MSEKLPERIALDAALLREAHLRVTHQSLALRAAEAEEREARAHKLRVAAVTAGAEEPEPPRPKGPGSHTLRAALDANARERAENAADIVVLRGRLRAACATAALDRRVAVGAELLACQRRTAELLVELVAADALCRHVSDTPALVGHSLPPGWVLRPFVSHKVVERDPDEQYLASSYSIRRGGEVRESELRREICAALNEPELPF